MPAGKKATRGEARPDIFYIPLPYGTPMRNVNVAVVGAFRSGKSALVEKLQQRKGMSSDIALYSYKSGDAVVTLVDVPGDADKMGPLMNALHMADAVLICVSAERGIEVQTGEALIGATAAGVRHAAVAITKSDSSTFGDLEKLKARVAALLKGGPFAGAPLFETSAVADVGVAEVAAHLASLSVPRSKEGTFKMGADHAIEPRAGFTVVTGTVKRGALHPRDVVTLLPWDREMVVQSIQVHNEDVPEVVAGDRIAVGFKGIHYHDIARGDTLCGAGSPVQKVKAFRVALTVDSFYKEPIALEQRLHLAAGLQFHPVVVKKITKNGAEAADARAGEACALEVEVERVSMAVEPGESCIVTRPELPGRMSRICGAGSVEL
ncbi:MAG: GTP-binding protein [Halobacteria archaeon]